MQPPVTHTGIPARENDYRVRPLAEPKSWVSDQTVEPLGGRSGLRADEASRLYTHNVEHFAQPTPAESVEPDAEPTVSPPPQWMIMIAGAAVAALMGALLGGFMRI